MKTLPRLLFTLALFATAASLHAADAPAPCATQLLDELKLM